jgi:hypothetical protein
MEYRFSKKNEQISVTQTISSLWFLLYLRFSWFWPWILDPTFVWGEMMYCLVDRYDTFIYWVACSLFLRNVSIHLPNYTASHLRRQESRWFLLVFRLLMSLKMLWRLPSCLFRISVIWNFSHAKTPSIRMNSSRVLSGSKNLWLSLCTFCIKGKMNYWPVKIVFRSNLGFQSEKGRTIAQAVSRWLPTRRPVFEPGSGHVGFVVDKVALGQVFSKYSRFPCQFLFHQLFHNHPHLSSGASTISQKWPHT